MKYYYTEKTYKQLLDNLIILHDSREQTSSHILDYFDKKNIKHEKRALKTGDYSFKIKACPELGFHIDTYFTDELCIERKNSINEIAGNIAEKDDRFLKELNRMINIQDCYILIEDDRIDDILEHKYNTKLNELSFIRTLLTTQKRSNFYLNFVKKENMGQMIYEICLNSLNSKILK
jgi:ERCC4-type nuclease